MGCGVSNPHSARDDEPSITSTKQDFIAIQTEPLVLQKIVDMVATPEAGAISTFSGTTRNNFEGKKVIRLEYEAYVPMAEKELKKLCNVIRNKWDVISIALFHR